MYVNVEDQPNMEVSDLISLNFLNDLKYLKYHHKVIKISLSEAYYLTCDQWNIKIKSL